MRITHAPTGVTVYCATTRSQHENRVRALAELERRLREAADTRSAAKLNERRAAQAIAERATRVFTWNTQRGTVVDHVGGRSWRLKDFARGRI